MTVVKCYHNGVFIETEFLHLVVVHVTDVDDFTTYESGTNFCAPFDLELLVVGHFVSPDF